MRADAERLQDILDAIGEAASRLSSEFRDKHPEVPWRGMIGMRNAVVHGYFSVDWDELWAVIERELEPLRRAVGAILRG